MNTVAFDNAALTGVGSCGCHQQVMGVAVASGDFTNVASANAADGVYTLNGVPCELEDIIDLDHPDTIFDPVENIDMDGIKLTDLGGGSWSNVFFELKEPLLSQLLATGFTLVLEVYAEDVEDDPDGSQSIASLTLHDPPYDQFQKMQYDCGLQTQLVAIDNTEYLNTTDNLVPSAQISKIAMTASGSRGAFSINGGVVGACESAFIDGDTTNISFDIRGGGTVRLRSFTFFELVDDTELPDFSA